VRAARREEDFVRELGHRRQAGGLVGPQAGHAALAGGPGRQPLAGGQVHEGPPQDEEHRRQVL
ncbi:hypothetical protein AAVH_42264, partial [Aphelenchoides avenae]